MKPLFNKMKTSMWKNFGHSEGNMLIWLGALGWILSSAAQIFVVATNDKFTKKEKSFMIPQECFDGLLNVGLFLFLSCVFKNGVSKMLKNGKLKIMDGNIDKTAKYKEPVTTIASIAGSVVACNIVTPLARNYLGARVQKRIMDNHLNQPENVYSTPTKIKSDKTFPDLQKRSDKIIFPSSMNGSIKI